MGVVSRMIVGLASVSLAIAFAGLSMAQAHSGDGYVGSGGAGMAEAPDHGDEHAWVTEARRSFERLPPERQRELYERDQRSSRSLFARTRPDSLREARSIGRWTQAPFALPNYAIHSVLLPTGRVLFWGYPPPSRFGNVGEATVWDPAKGYEEDAFKSVPPPIIDPDGPQGPQEPGPAPIYCSGQSLLANGVVLLAGGNYTWPRSDPNDEYTGDTGLDTVFTFSPWTETWQQQPSMSAGHWYPSQVLLGDGRTLILGGFSEEAPGEVLTDDLEIFSPSSSGGAIGSTERSAAGRITGLYPHLFTLPNGNVFMGGPNSLDSALIKQDRGNPSDFKFQDLPDVGRDRIGGTAVLHPAGPRGSWRVTQFGGFSYEGAPADYEFLPATPSAETFNAKNASSGWRQGPAFQVRRSYQNTVLLPDSSMVTIGGGAGRTSRNNHGLDPGTPQRRVEILDRGSDTWRLGPAQLEDRTYHSTAILLPDGRVWSAGDDLYPLLPGGAKSEEDTAEIYSPPYLFKGPRPDVTKVPVSVGFNERFRIETSLEGARAEKAVLVAPGATTHAADMHQRVIGLQLKDERNDGLSVVSPRNSDLAPPGYYMLFTLNAKGVPSLAKWIRVG